MSRIFRGLDPQMPYGELLNLQSQKGGFGVELLQLLRGHRRQMLKTPIDPPARELEMSGGERILGELLTRPEIWSQLFVVTWTGGWGFPAVSPIQENPSEV